jgi:hypothetical protein
MKDCFGSGLSVAIGRFRPKADGQVAAWARFGYYPNRVPPHYATINDYFVTCTDAELALPAASVATAFRV